MWPTDKHGVTSFTTIVPGFYVSSIHPLESPASDWFHQVQRAIHIHVQIHTNWTILSNGTLAHGSIVSTGQIFIDELLSRQLMALEPYVSHTEIERVENADDGIYNQESASKSSTPEFNARRLTTFILSRCYDPPWHGAAWWQGLYEGRFWIYYSGMFFKFLCEKSQLIIDLRASTWAKSGTEAQSMPVSLWLTLGN